MINLPEELIDLIHEYEGNTYYKTNYNVTMKQLLGIVNKYICSEDFVHIEYVYRVYCSHNMTHHPKLTFGQYMLYIIKKRKHRYFPNIVSFPKKVFKIA